MVIDFSLEREAGVNLVILTGRLLGEEDVYSISKSVLEVVDGVYKNVIFDLKELNYVNSSGINMFMKVITKSRVNNGEVLFIGVSGDVEKLFDIAKLNEIYTIYSTKEEAISHFKR